MARGAVAPDGTTRLSPNGYHNTKRDGRWRFTHHLVAEDQILGRPLQPWERVVFIDGDRTNITKDNLRIMNKSGMTFEQKIAKIDQEIEMLERLKVELIDTEGPKP